MATRDRTTEFIQLRSSRGKNPDAQKLIDDMKSAAIFVSPPWVEKMGDVRSLCKKIQDMMKDLESKQKQHLKVEFSANRDEESEQTEIDRSTTTIDALFKRSEGMITELDAVYLQDKQEDGGTDSELAILRNIKLCLIGEVTQLSKQYRDNQRRYASDLTKQRKAAGNWSRKNEAEEIAAKLERDAKIERYLQKGMTQDQIEAVMLNTDMVNERVKEFEKIYASIKSLHEMFKDMNVMIAEQGTVLDRIDYNMTMTVERVTKAKEELKQAAELQKAGTFKLCVLFLIVLIVGFLLALFFKIVA